MSLWPFGQGQLDNFQPKGVCLVWNLKYKRETPEYVFTSESPLVTARHVHCMYKDIYDSYLDQTILFRFSMFHPNLIIGGAYSGQIMLWDNRCRFFATAFQSFARKDKQTRPGSAIEVLSNCSHITRLLCPGFR